MATEKVARGVGKDLVRTGHACTGITTTAECSPDCFINSLGAVRIGDHCAGHTVPAGDACVAHAPKLSTSSVKVFVNGRGLGRVSDGYSGEIIITGSADTFAG